MGEGSRGGAAPRRRDRVRARATAMADRVGETRPDAPALDAALETYERDADVGGGLLAGAIAFRLFLLAVPLFLILVAGLGFVDASDGDMSGIGESTGLSEVMIETMAQTGEDARRGRWVTLVVGMTALVLATRTIVRYLWDVHLLSWRQPRRAVPHQAAALGAGLGVVALLVVFVAWSQWLRSRTPGGGLTVSIVIGAGVGAIWLGVSMFLPRDPRAPWTALVPGAVLLAVTSQVLHLVTLLYFVGRVSRMTTTYGAFGVAMVMLVWFYFVGRCLVGSAMVNATLWDRGDRGVRSFAPLVLRNRRLRLRGQRAASGHGDSEDGPAAG